MVVNDTNIVLILKRKEPKNIADHRPINLSNVIYKLVTKTFANRLKLVLPQIISHQQSAFVLGCLITDNIIIVFELLHTLGKKNNSKKGFIALKLDVSKAYDRVEWSFICKVMERMGFPLRWQRMVYDCILMVKFSFYLNGTVQGRVIPSRGFRQGCSLSPYLFLLYAEAFSSVIQATEDKRLFMGVRCSLQCPRVSHLFFADDSIVFVREKDSDALAIKKILDTYEHAFGQKINFEESTITFSPNIGEEMREEV